MTASPDTLTATFRLGWQGQVLDAAVTVPTGPVRPRILLPVIQQFTNQLLEHGEAVAAAQGEAVSCRAGCTACCRHLVPVTEAEAYHLRDLVAAMPEPRRSAVEARYADALGRLNEAGLLDELRAPLDIPNTIAFGLAYFRAGVPCPFLEAENCSIYPDRPLVCREFLVTSPAANCSDPTPDTIRRVPLLGRPMTAFATLDGPTPNGEGIRWIPLVTAREWADAHPEPPAIVAGTDLFSRFMTALTRNAIPAPGDFAGPTREPTA